MNREQIVELLKDWKGLSGSIPYPEELADEILALDDTYSKLSELDPDKFPLVHDEDCFCRECQPDWWFKDSRGVWCRKGEI